MRMHFWAARELGFFEQHPEFMDHYVRLIGHSTTVSETLGDGMMEKVAMILSGYSSLILEMRRVPIPDPVPPPREWVTWKPWRQSQPSASFLTTSRTESMSSAPSV